MTAPPMRSDSLPVREAVTAPWTDWKSVSRTVNKIWDPRNTPHHSIIGLTGSGKSFLAINGIAKPMLANDRVLIIDSKGDDPLVSTSGHGCLEIPKRTWGPARKKQPFDSWHRLVVHSPLTPEGHAKAKRQVTEALYRVYKEGDWVVIFDEIRDMTGSRRPQLGLEPIVDEIYRKGRSRGISLIACTQAPRWVGSSFYDQCSFAWIGRLRDEDKQKRLLEIGGLSKRELPLVASLKRREWLLSADNGEQFYRTEVKV